MQDHGTSPLGLTDGATALDTPRGDGNGGNTVVVPDQTPTMTRREQLCAHKIRPTKIRIAIADLLFDGRDKHVSVDDVIDMARAANIKTSIASVYNTLNQFSTAGLLRRVQVEPGRTFFDTNLGDHHHYYYEDEARLVDIPANALGLRELPEIPEGQILSSVAILIRLSAKP